MVSHIKDTEEELSEFSILQGQLAERRRTYEANYSTLDSEMGADYNTEWKDADKYFEQDLCHSGGMYSHFNLFYVKHMSDCNPQTGIQLQENSEKIFESVENFVVTCAVCGLGQFRPRQWFNPEARCVQCQAFLYTPSCSGRKLTEAPILSQEVRAALSTLEQVLEMHHNVPPGPVPDDTLETRKKSYEETLRMTVPAPKSVPKPTTSDDAKSLTQPDPPESVSAAEEKAKEIAEEQKKVVAQAMVGGHILAPTTKYRQYYPAWPCTDRKLDLYPHIEHAYHD